MELPEIVTIKKVVKENQKVKTFFFDMSETQRVSEHSQKSLIFDVSETQRVSEHTQEPLVLDKKIKALPGQFIMLWLPGVDEKPFALSYNNAVTIECKGIFTRKTCYLKKGDKFGVRGPYGNGFKIKKNALVVAGGLGIASLAGLIDKLQNPEIILGAKTKNELLFEKRFKNKKLNIATDDGSFGFKGFATELIKEILKKKKFKIVYTCGPEIMMKKVFEICEKRNIECQASLERYMKCGGLGICGTCACGDQLVCKDGPVFNSKQLKELNEFGRFARLKSGKKVTINKYVKWRGK